MIILLLLLISNLLVFPMMHIAVNPDQPTGSLDLEIFYRRSSGLDELKTALVRRCDLDQAMEHGPIIELEINGSRLKFIPNQTIIAERQTSKSPRTLERCKSFKGILAEIYKKADEEAIPTALERKPTLPKLYRFESEESTTKEPRPGTPAFRQQKRMAKLSKPLSRKCTNKFELFSGVERTHRLPTIIQACNFEKQC